MYRAGIWDGKWTGKMEKRENGIWGLKTGKWDGIWGYFSRSPVHFPFFSNQCISPSDIRNKPYFLRIKESYFFSRFWSWDPRIATPTLLTSLNSSLLPV